MFDGTLGRSQFFVRSCIVGIVETILVGICIAVQHEAFFGPPGQGRHPLAAAVFMISAVFCFKRISFAIRRNRHAGGGELLPGLYAIGICAALVLQIQWLIVRTSDSLLDGTGYAGLLHLVLTGVWLSLLFKTPAAGMAQASAGPQALGLGRAREDDASSGPSQLSLAMEQAISGQKPISAMPAPARPQGFLGSVRHAPPPRQRGEFGRRGLK
jgi:hypothetical protein